MRFLNLAKSLTFAILLTWVNINSACADSLPGKLNFQHLLENKDIALREILCFHQDNRGFMWIGGGGGLVRYDGYEFKFISQAAKTDQAEEKLAIKNVQDIFEDSDGVLWISTRAGFFRYDPRTEVLTAIPDNSASEYYISTANSYASTDLPSGELIVASGSGLFILDKKTLNYWTIVPDKSKQHWLSHQTVKGLYKDGAGVVWLGTGAGLERLDWATKTFTLIKPHPDHPDQILANEVITIAEDPNGSLWLGTSDGLVNYDPTSHKRIRYTHDAGDPNSIEGKEIAKVMMDLNGTLWIASDGGGIALFEKSNQFPQGRFNNQKHEPGRETSLNSNQVRTVYQDRAGDVWVGNYPEGVNYFDRSSTGIISYSHDQSDPFSLSHSAVLAVREDKNHNLWIGTDGGGLNFFDRQKDKFIRYINNPNDPESLSGNAVLDVFIADDGTVWSGTWGGGISILDPSTGFITRLPFDIARPKSTAISSSKRLNNSTVWSIKQDRQNTIWLGTHSEGLSKYDRATQTYTHYTNIDDDPTSITRGVIWDTLEDSQGNFWVGTATGLDLMDREKGTFTHFRADPNDPNSLRSPSTISLFEDSKNRFWVGTEAGLHLMNREEGTFTNYNKSYGFNDDAIRTILETSDGNLWLATNNGVSVFNPETQKVKNYNRASGRLIGSFHTDSGVISNKGEIIFGGVEGLRIFDALKLKGNQTPPPVVLTGFRLFADAIGVGDDSQILKQALTYTDRIVLDYTKTMFSFEYSALNFRDPNKNNYAYMLEGFDKSWLQVGDQRTAKYTNLNPGTYVFRVKGSNNDGVWNDQGSTITLIQLPAPWRTWWAYTIYALIAVAIVILFIHSQRKKRQLVEHQNRLLEIKVAERTGELRDKNNDIKAMLSNMRQGLFTIEKSGNIHAEYSQFLEEIFATREIAGVKATKLLFDNAMLGSNELNQAQEAIFAIIDEDEINFDFNKGLLIAEYGIKQGNALKFLSLDWNPIILEGKVAKLMVSVRDVTLLKKMEEEAVNKKRELDIISQLLNISAKKYAAFSTSTKRFIQDNRTRIEQTTQRSEAPIALLFRNMHTIKGNCRTFGFTHLSNLVHDVETTYSNIKSNPDSGWPQEKLLAELADIERLFNDYEHAYYNVLGRDAGGLGGRDQNGFWADKNAIDTIQNSIDSALNQYPILKESQPLSPIQDLLNNALSSPISDLIVDVVNSLPTMAIALEKEVPTIVIDEQNIRIKSSANDLINNIFVHIFRNAVDHGIERPEERVAAGKPAKGTIELKTEAREGKLQIRIKDDGQGIDIERLFKRGVDLGKWHLTDSPSDIDIANLIFESGISTKETVSDISGRGVGMEAVREFLSAQGGNISLNLLPSKPLTSHVAIAGRLPFELVVELPESTFIAAA